MYHGVLIAERMGRKERHWSMTSLWTQLDHIIYQDKSYWDKDGCNETLASLLYFQDPSKRLQFLQLVFILTFELFSLSSWSNPNLVLLFKILDILSRYLSLLRRTALLSFYKFFITKLVYFVRLFKSNFSF